MKIKIIILILFTICFFTSKSQEKTKSQKNYINIPDSLTKELKSYMEKDSVNKINTQKKVEKLEKQQNTIQIKTQKK